MVRENVPLCSSLGQDSLTTLVPVGSRSPLAVMGQAGLQASSQYWLVKHRAGQQPVMTEMNNSCSRKAPSAEHKFSPASSSLLSCSLLEQPMQCYVYYIWCIPYMLLAVVVGDMQDW